MLTRNFITKTITTLAGAAETDAAVNPEIITSVTESVKSILRMLDKVVVQNDLINTQEYIDLQDAMNKWSVRNPGESFEF